MVSLSSAGSPRRSSLMRWGFALSLGLNLFFLGGYGYHLAFAPGPMTDAQRFEAVAETLNLTAPQRAALDVMRESMRVGARAARTVGETTMTVFGDEFSKPEPSRPAVEAAVKRLEEARCDVLKSRAESFVTFMEALDTPQRVELLRFVRDRAAEMPTWMRPGR